MIKIPHRCYHRKTVNGNVVRCNKRMSIKRGTEGWEVPCPKCGNKTMGPDRYRLKKDEMDRGERCDCSGPKSKRDPKTVYLGDVLVVLGPHRKGQSGCMYNKDYGKPDEAKEAFHAAMRASLGMDDCPF